MQLNLFFSSRDERLDAVRILCKAAEIDLKEEELNHTLVLGMSQIRLKSSHKGIPGFWLTYEDDPQNPQNKENMELLSSLGASVEAAAFPLENMTPKMMEESWAHKYRLLREVYTDDCWNLFYREIKAHIRSKRYDFAFYGLLVILKYNPFYLKKYKRFYQFEELAYYYEEVGNLSKAIKCLKVHLILQPDSVEPYLNMSSFFIINEMEEEAITICREALKKNPHNKYLVSNLVLALSNLGKYDYAVEYMRKIVQKHPDSGFYWKLMGDLLYEVENNQEAIECYQKALKKVGNNCPEDFLVDLYNGIAATAYEMENFQESAAYYQKVLGHYPSDPYVLLSLSQIYFYKLENIKEALKYGKILLEKAPENGYGHYQIGLIYMKLENFEKAKWHLYRAKKIMPYYEPVLEAIHYLKQVDRVLKVHQSSKRKK